MRRKLKIVEISHAMKLLLQQKIMTFPLQRFFFPHCFQPTCGYNNKSITQILEV